jgi:hypothetical protein
MMPSYRRRIFPGLSFPLILLCIWGLIVGPPDRDEAERQRQIECAPLQWRASMDTEGWSLLIDNGYTVVQTANGQALLPTGCESENPR